MQFLPCKSLLLTRGLLHQNDIFCLDHEEDVQHVIFECPFAGTIWNFIDASTHHDLVGSLDDLLHSCCLPSMKILGQLSVIRVGCYGAQEMRKLPLLERICLLLMFLIKSSYPNGFRLLKSTGVPLA